MADLKTHKTFKNTNFEVLTHEGFKDFKGLMIGENPIKLILKFTENKSLICTPKHKIVLTDGAFKYAKDLMIDDSVYGNYKLLEKNEFISDDLVYEFLEIKDNHKYYVNGLLSNQCLVLDELAFLECLSGETFIKVRNKKTKEIQKIKVEEFIITLTITKIDEDIYDIINVYSNSDEWEIETPNGWSDFKGITKMKKKQLYSVTTENNKNVIVSRNHFFIDENGTKLHCKDALGKKIKTIDGIEKVTKIEKCKRGYVYDFISVENGNIFYGNDILHHNCGLLESFWRSVYPIISSAKTSKILAASTPNGIGNLFHTLWEGSQKKGDEWNGWNGERVDWWEVPKRDEKWKNETIRTLGSRDAFAQEYENAFLAAGEIPIDQDVYRMLESSCKDPEFIFDDGQYIVWDEPNEKKFYAIGVDVGEGLNQNASVIQILNITDLTNITQDAVYYTKKQSPYNFAQKLHDILQQWGRPPVLVERNGCGGQVIDSLKMNYGYENIVTWGTRGAISNDFKVNDKSGIISHQNSKIEAITNMRYYMNEMRVVKLRDTKTLHELKDFIRHPNGTWSGRSANTLDDRVMSLVWAIAVLQNDICKKYFEIVSMDDNQRPLKLKPIDYGITDITLPQNIYINEKDAQAFMPLPSIFPDQPNSGDEFSHIPDYEILKKDGWSLFNSNFS